MAPTLRNLDLEGRHTLVDGLESFDEGKLLGFIVKEAIFLFDDVLQRLEVPDGRVVVLFNLCAREKESESQ